MAASKDLRKGRESIGPPRDIASLGSLEHQEEGDPLPLLPCAALMLSLLPSPSSLPLCPPASPYISPCAF